MPVSRTSLSVLSPVRSYLFTRLARLVLRARNTLELFYGNAFYAGATRRAESVRVDPDLASSFVLGLFAWNSNAKVVPSSTGNFRSVSDNLTNLDCVYGSDDSRVTFKLSIVRIEKSIEDGLWSVSTKG